MTNLDDGDARHAGKRAEGYRSRFGGLWPDRADANDELESRLSSGRITEAQAAAIDAFMRDGVFVLERAVPEDVVDRIRSDIEALWSSGNAEVFVEEWTSGRKRIAPIDPSLRDHRTKLLDLYAFSEAAREAVFAPAVRAFLAVLFERPPLAFQSLMFQRGTAQPMHQDTAFVGVESPLEFVGSWLALEDIEAGSGELEYYLGSHRLEEYLFDGRYKKMPPGFAGEADYLESLHAKAAQAKLERVRHRPRKGDVIVWHADLAHGGASIQDAKLTRWSLVTHYCPVDVTPDYFAKLPHSGRIQHSSGGFYSHPRRGAPKAWQRMKLRATRLAKTAASRLRRGI